MSQVVKTDVRQPRFFQQGLELRKEDPRGMEVSSHGTAKDEAALLPCRTSFELFLQLTHTMLFQLFQRQGINGDVAPAFLRFWFSLDISTLVRLGQTKQSVCPRFGMVSLCAPMLILALACWLRSAGGYHHGSLSRCIAGFSKYSVFQYSTGRRNP